MPKMILEFDLPSEKVEADQAWKGSAYYCALVEIKDKIRHWNKYESKDKVTMEDLYTMLHEIIGDLLE